MTQDRRAAQAQHDWRHELSEGLRALACTLPANAETRLADFIVLLVKWNRIYNLTAIRQPAAMVSHHLLDSLAVLPYLPIGGRLADVGSGAGVPAIPLAIARPDLTLVSIEAADKKAAFQRQAKIELALDNLEIHGQRAETLQIECEAVISRAFASLTDFVHLAGHLAPRLLAMKGRARDEPLPAGWRITATHPLTVPGLAAQRCLMVLEKET